MQKKTPSVIGLIACAGTGSRCQRQSPPKQYQPLAGQTSLRRSIEVLLTHPAVASVYVIIHPDHLDFYQQATANLPLPAPILGGATRQASIRRGLEALSDQSPDYVLIHDAARPFIDHAMIDRILNALATYQAVIPAIACTDTIKIVTNGRVERTLDRHQLRRIQTPQGFDFKTILHLHQSYQNTAVTDDAALCELDHIDVHTIEGSPNNIKLTTLDDMQQAQRYLTSPLLRSGIGFDVHRFATTYDDDNYITLCGIPIPHPYTLIGHSDADVGIHAIVDALLGAMGQGDIGEHFPDNDPGYKGADSSQFLQHCQNLLHNMQGFIHNIDAIIMCEAPRISPYKSAMQHHIAKILEIPPQQVNVKATTTEKLGFTGRQEGIAVQANALIQIGGTLYGTT